MRAAAVVVLVVACSFHAREPFVDAPPPEPDAPPADAATPVFDPARDCGAAYTESLPLTLADSRYRVITTPATYWQHAATCAADPHAHPVIFETAQEVLDLTARLTVVAPGTVRYYIGAVQNPAATACDQGWVTLAGAPLVGGLWYTATGVPEPNDNDDGIENGGQQLGILDRVETYLQDAVGASTYGGLCECDAVAVSATAQGYVDADPNNPN